eukprot:1139857-Pelagomonas_calceolata.AAC.3
MLLDAQTLLLPSSAAARPEPPPEAPVKTKRVSSECLAPYSLLSLDLVAPGGRAIWYNESNSIIVPPTEEGIARGEYMLEQIGNSCCNCSRNKSQGSPKSQSL